MQCLDLQLRVLCVKSCGYGAKLINHLTCVMFKQVDISRSLLCPVVCG
jgi:hypothetical protein